MRGVQSQYGKETLAALFDKAAGPLVVEAGGFTL